MSEVAKLRQALSDLLDYHTKPAGFNGAMLMDDKQFGEFLKGISVAGDEVVARARDAIASSADLVVPPGIDHLMNLAGAMAFRFYRHKAQETSDSWAAYDAARCELHNAVLAALFVEAQDVWQPIETAPKDGTMVYLHQGGKVFEGSWLDIPFVEHRDMDGFYVGQQDAESYWMDHKDGEALAPTEWMPKTLPATPTEEASK